MQMERMHLTCGRILDTMGQLARRSLFPRKGRRRLLQSLRTQSQKLAWLPIWQISLRSAGRSSPLQRQGLPLAVPPIKQKLLQTNWQTFKFEHLSLQTGTVWT